MCATFANYARACARKHIYVHWRKPGFCGMLGLPTKLTKILERPVPEGPWLSPMAYWISKANPSQNIFVPTERLCPGGQLYSDCVSSCPPSCSAVAQGEEGSCGKECVSGCECPDSLFWDGSRCVPAAHCPCYHRRQRYAPGDIVNQLCNPWWVFEL